MNACRPPACGACAERPLAPRDAFVQGRRRDDEVIEGERRLSVRRGRRDGQVAHSVTWPSTQTTVWPPIQMSAPTRSTCTRPARPSARALARDVAIAARDRRRSAIARGRRSGCRSPDLRATPTDGTKARTSNCASSRRPRATGRRRRARADPSPRSRARSASTASRESSSSGDPAGPVVDPLRRAQRVGRDAQAARDLRDAPPARPRRCAAAAAPRTPAARRRGGCAPGRRRIAARSRRRAAGRRRPARHGSCRASDGRRTAARAPA